MSLAFGFERAVCGSVVRVCASHDCNGKPYGIDEILQSVTCVCVSTVRVFLVAT